MACGLGAFQTGLRHLQRNRGAHRHNRNAFCPGPPAAGWKQAAGNDIAKYRKVYGKNLLMSGGIDKRALARGKRAIDSELEQKIPYALDGGYVPTIDHGIPADVPYENFAYYWQRKKELLGIKQVTRSTRHFFW